MVVDTTYYDALQVSPTATDLEIKKAYRKLAIRLHPDKNPGDEQANERFQAIGEAYQVLSDPQTRAKYDRDGKDAAKPDEGFADPSEFFTMIFGGEAFVDWIGEISLMKDLTKSMEMSERMEQEDVKAAEEEAQQQTQDVSGADEKPVAQESNTASESTAAPPTYDHSQGKNAPPEKPASSTASPPPYSDAQAKEAPPEKSTTNTETSAEPANPYSQIRPQGIPLRPALMDRSEEEARMEAAGFTEKEKELRAKEKKKGLSKEQREELLAYQRERERVRDERVEMLARKLTDRISVWTETDKGADVTKAFRDKTKLEVENLKMESFGLEILHAVGQVYLNKGSNFLKSQKFLGISGFFGRLKDKGSLAKDIWGTFSTAIEAQMSMEEMAKAEERGGAEWTDEARAEHERIVTGKILAAAWRGSRFEIQGVLRDVCDKVLNDKKFKLEKRVERAQALVLIGELLRDAKRTPEEENENMVFEQLMADAMRKKEDKEGKKKKKDKRESGHGHGFGHSRGDKVQESTAEAST